MFDDNLFLEAIEEIETSDQSAAVAKHDTKRFLTGKGVKIPDGLEIIEIKRESPILITCAPEGPGHPGPSGPQTQFPPKPKWPIIIIKW
jgi:hypothetical protein